MRYLIGIVVVLIVLAFVGLVYQVFNAHENLKGVQVARVATPTVTNVPTHTPLPTYTPAPTSIVPRSAVLVYTESGCEEDFLEMQADRYRYPGSIYFIRAFALSKGITEDEALSRYNKCEVLKWKADDQRERDAGTIRQQKHQELNSAIATATAEAGK